VYRAFAFSFINQEIFWEFKAYSYNGVCKSKVKKYYAWNL